MSPHAGGMRRLLLLGLLGAATAAAQDPFDIAIRPTTPLARATKAAGSPAGSPATPTPPAYKEPMPLGAQPDWSSVDAIVTALYASVSHGPEYEPNWVRLRALFLPQALIVPPQRPDAETVEALDVDRFEARIRRYITGRRERHEALGFTEREIARRESRFGDVCQVFSSYETVRSPKDKEPFFRGVHSLQLVSDSRRWWIAALVWDGERADNPIPPELLSPAAIR